MSKSIRKHSKKDIKLTKQENIINSNRNLLVDSASFKTYEIPQLNNWIKILNKKQQKQNIKKIHKHKQIKKKTFKRKKITKRKTKKSFLGLF